MASWSKQKVLEFIELYQSHESLWRIKSKDYSNRLLKEKAYNQLVEFVKTFDSEADKDYILRKINNLRGCFRKELRKVESSKSSGTGTDEIYQPKLWYFSNLLFLKDQEGLRETCPSLEPDPFQSQDVQMPDLKQETQDLSSPSTPVDFEEGVHENLIPTQPRQQQPFSEDKRPYEKKTVDESLLSIANNRLLNPRSALSDNDEFDLYGKSIAHKLRKLPREQRIHIQKLFSDLIYEAELSNLSRESVVIATPACDDDGASAQAALWKKKWKNQRDTYLKRRKDKNNRNGHKSMRSWKFNGLLTFLDPFTDGGGNKRTESYEFYDTSAPVVEYEHDASNDTIDNNRTNDQDHLSISSGNSPSHQYDGTEAISETLPDDIPDHKPVRQHNDDTHYRKPLKRPSEELPSGIMNFLEEPKRRKEQDQLQDPQTPESIFFQSCAQRIMELPKQTRGLLMLQIQQLFFNAENPNVQVPITSLMPP